MQVFSRDEWIIKIEELKGSFGFPTYKDQYRDPEVAEFLTLELWRLEIRYRYPVPAHIFP